MQCDFRYVCLQRICRIIISHTIGLNEGPLYTNSSISLEWRNSLKKKERKEMQNQRAFRNFLGNSTEVRKEH